MQIMDEIEKKNEKKKMDEIKKKLRLKQCKIENEQAKM